MSQAAADLPPQETASDQAYAGYANDLDPMEARVSEVSSEHLNTADPPDDAFADFGPGRDGDSDARDDVTSLEAYQAARDALLSGAPVAPSPSDQLDPVDDWDADPSETAQAPAPAEHEGEDTVRQYRFRPRSPVDQRAFDLMKADKYLTAEAAIDQARAELRPSAPDETDSYEESYDDPTGLEAEPDTVEAIRAQIRALRREAIAAKRLYDADSESDIEEQILNLEEQLPVVEARQRELARQESEAANAWQTQAIQSAERVKARFPQAADPNSRFAQRMAEIDDAWEGMGDARFDDPNKAELIAELVAKEAGVTPRQPAAPGRTLPTTSRPSASPSRPGPMAVLAPASGSARTSDASAPRIERVIASVNDQESYERLKEQLLRA